MWTAIGIICILFFFGTRAYIIIKKEKKRDYFRNSIKFNLTMDTMFLVLLIYIFLKGAL